jgi:hypothetical protein
MSPVRVSGLDSQKIVLIEAGYHSAAVNFKGDLLIWGTSSLGEYLSP